jgi:TRAP-type uncharacterized transport system substrate-binding protein
MKRCFAFLFALAFSLSAFSQQLVVSTGAPSGTYSKMFKELSAECTPVMSVPLIEKNSGGSVDNIDKILANEVNAGIVQTDVLFFRAKTDDLSRVKTLVTLFPEEVHILALSANRKEGGVMGMGAKEISVNTLSDLNGRKVGSWGGSFVTAQVVRLQSEVAFSTVEFPDQKSALAALTAGQVDAILAVGGAPLDWVKSLSRAYKLVDIREAFVGKLKGIYKPAKVSYPNLGQSGVSTVSTDSILVTREYKTPRFVESLSALRSCFRTNIEDLQEKPGNHAKWMLVDPNTVPKWPAYVLPETSVGTSKKK